MIVLDLYSEVVPQYQRLRSYFGQPFIWCMLHNFGGTLPLYGDIQSVNEVTELCFPCTVVFLYILDSYLLQSNFFICIHCMFSDRAAHLQDLAVAAFCGVKVRK